MTPDEPARAPSEKLSKEDADLVIKVIEEVEKEEAQNQSDDPAP